MIDPLRMLAAIRRERYQHQQDHSRTRQLADAIRLGTLNSLCARVARLEERLDSVTDVEDEDVCELSPRCLRQPHGMDEPCLTIDDLVAAHEDKLTEDVPDEQSDEDHLLARKRLVAGGVQLLPWDGR